MSGVDLAADAELISCANRLIAAEVDLQHLFALNIGPMFVFQQRYSFASRRLDHVARRRIDVAAVDTERNPARLIPQGDAEELLGRPGPGVENVDAAVRPVCKPDFLFVRAQRDPVTRAPVTLHRAFLESFNLHAVEHLPGDQIADLESQQIVHVYIAERLTPVDRERANAGAERPDRARDGMLSGAGDPEQR